MTRRAPEPTKFNLSRRSLQISEENASQRCDRQCHFQANNYWRSGGHRIPSYISRPFRMSDANWGSPSSSRSAFSGLRQLLSLFEQSSDLSHLRPNADVDELPPIEINGKKYIKEEWTQEIRAGNTSWDVSFYSLRRHSGSVGFVIRNIRRLCSMLSRPILSLN